ncbi:MAG: homocysteine S-methyltransferase family protein, partial [Eubacteriales bacterium]|nr:homocysteine S-methyltransferase family protein [Eubacteriales bacterium]
MALFGEKRLIFDGGMGTMLQAAGLRGGEHPARWNVERPDVIESVHAAYLGAGSELIASNTFGASEYQLGEGWERYVDAGVRIARRAVERAGHGLAALDVGSLGHLLAPYGDMELESAVAAFRRFGVCGLKAGADVVLVETMTDLMEIKAAVLGLREAMAETGLERPLLVSMSVNEQGRLLTGADVRGAAAMLCALKVDGVGLNCGGAPEKLMAPLQTLLSCCERPVFFQPNASLPVMENGHAVYPTTPESFAQSLCEAARLGVDGLGGCCGTTPEHLRLMVERTREIAKPARTAASVCTLSGRTDTAVLPGAPLLIGERLNPTGKKRMKQALREGDLELLRREALDQLAAGAGALDVNVGLPDIDERAMLVSVTQAVQGVCGVPLQLDTADASALEGALRVYCGRPLINSVSGKQASLDAVLPLARKYGGAVVALLLDENGIPPTVTERLEIADRILAAAKAQGLSERDLLFDALTLTISTDESAALTTLETVRALHRRGLMTVLGASNVSFGLPQRPLLTGAFLAMTVQAGLTAAIMNPLDPVARGMLDAAAALCGRDERLAHYLSAYADAPSLTLSASAAPGAPQAAAAPEDALGAAIARGLAQDARREAEQRLSAGEEPLSVVEGGILPALNAVGERYEKGTLFLPQLLQSATAAQAAFAAVREALPAASREGGAPIVLATVEGDVHDIGKNIVSVLLQNYGFTVIDLGKDVPAARVLEAVRQSGARLCGLSALMTTTVPAMRDTIALLRREAPEVKIVVGGAVLTADLAQKLGADCYGRDALATVRYAQETL